ncbi:glycoside hydrolase domain-containing protein [Amycolatopsis cihanbeyliensis]|uniref:Peptidoglycan hydrolase-like protein with peptidoglycan-binding domain n=1 Tax=Amycolatopsis cihanbeyliensis TaxID=1128664 RepID=A0A542CU15_AMYCI|nr:glycoside hydrolase domain-containing protein [Amycolatopsis cihanbeyliensis]TQI94280.1 peptidoglycan hydrolase-like protein with peptidoglycan-binding domain [Amycolatopsis cihanbeyliensis]
MDEKVLEAQEWVNATYGGVAGYQRCPEDGRTGWNTMWSLTMGLQHELGISPVVANFGPGTLSGVRALGDIGFGWDQNSNIVRIIQHALFCKGYWGANGYGGYGAVTTEAVKEMRRDMGLPDGGSGTTGGQVTPKIFKALLTMDAYIILGGGREEVLEIQRWLNGRYWTKPNYFIGPCDGHFSRDVQQALVKALQYEMGVPGPNGNFGPGTKAALRQHPQHVGSSGPVTQLFHAACIFNEPVPGTSGVGFRDEYTSATAEFIRAFQTFSALPDTGDGDFATWAQLLVSTGDPDRPADACDTRFTITPSRAQALYQAGYRAVGRYLDEHPSGTLDKEIKPGELQAIFDAGLRCFPIWQYNARQLEDFTYSSGYQHGLKAHARGEHYGFNSGTVVYFAVDYDATDPEISSNIVPYFHGVRGALNSQGSKYIPGVYGSRNVCARASAEAYVSHSFVSGMSWGFSGNLGFPLPLNWSFNQIKEFEFHNGDDVFDLDRVVHRPGADFGVNSINRGTTTVDEFLTYLEQVHNLAVGYDSSRASKLTLEWLRYPKYNDFEWRNIFEGVDEGFIAECRNAGLEYAPKYDYQDPSFGVAISVDHLCATANAYLLKGSGDRAGLSLGDLGGWCGDLITFYGEWVRDEPTNKDGYKYAMDRLAKPNVATTFMLNDLIEDMDGHHIGMAVRDGANVVTEFRNLLTGGGHLSRVNRFFSSRYGTMTDTNNAAVACLTGAPANPVDAAKYAAAREVLVERQSGEWIDPTSITPSDLRAFCKGYADTLNTLRGLEDRRLRALKED